MADEVDLANAHIELESSLFLQAAQKKAEGFVKGQEGECELCGEWFERVIQVTFESDLIFSCGKCRDTHRIK